MSRTSLYALVQKAVATRPDGIPFGWEACVPGAARKGYELGATSPGHGAGWVTRFFQQNPDLLELLTDWVLGRKSPDVGKVRGRRISRLWEGFKKECELRKIEMANAPGQRAIGTVVREIRQSEFLRVAKLADGETAALVANTGLRRVRTETVPYRQVQFDGHRLDGVITIAIEDTNGIWLDLVLERLWLLVLLECASRAVLGYHISFERNYSGDDVLSCFANAITPWRPLPIPEGCQIAYPRNGGLPCGVVPGCEHRAFDTLLWDNHMAHHSEGVQWPLVDTFRCRIVTGRPRNPFGRSLLERFLGTYEEASLHRWPMTTGCGPDDPRRHRPEDAAQRIQAREDDLHLITDISMARYNVAPHTALHGRSPLEYLTYSLSHDRGLVRSVKRSTSGETTLFRRVFPGRVAGDLKKGRRPLVRFLGVEYRNEALKVLATMIGQKIQLVVNTKDIREITAYRSDGSYIGVLRAEPRWFLQPHSIRTRRSINRLTRIGHLSRDSRNPVGDHLRFMEERARRSRRDRNRLAQQRREIGGQEVVKTAGGTRVGEAPGTLLAKGWVSISKVRSR
jgi:hypothetical protein